MDFDSDKNDSTTVVPGEGGAAGEAAGPEAAGNPGAGGDAAGGKDAGGGGAPAPERPRPSEWVAFDTDEGGPDRNIYAVEIATGERRAIVEGEANEVHPAFSPDGRYLAFVSDEDDFTQQIFVMDLESSEITQLTTGTPPATRPAFTPDGTRVGFRRGAWIHSIALDGSDERQLPNSQTIAGQPDDGGGPAFSPADDWIVMDGYNAVWTLKPDGSERRDILAPTTARQSNPTRSGSGFTIAVEVTCGDGRISLWSVPFSGGSGWICMTGTRLSPGDGADHMHPAFGPDDALVWDRSVAAGDIMMSAGGTVTSLTSGPADDRNPTWVPGGTELP